MENTNGILAVTQWLSRGRRMYNGREHVLLVMEKIKMPPWQILIAFTGGWTVVALPPTFQAPNEWNLCSISQRLHGGYGLGYKQAHC